MELFVQIKGLLCKLSNITYFAMHEKDCHLNGLETFSVRLGCSHIIVLHNTTLKRTNLSLLL